MYFQKVIGHDIDVVIKFTERRSLTKNASLWNESRCLAMSARSLGLHCASENSSRE